MTCSAVENSLEYHPLANEYPLLEGLEYEEFKAGIVKAGIIREKIVLLDGKILDGRNRYRAGMETGIPVPARQYDPELDGDDPVLFVENMNDDRRHEEHEIRRRRKQERVKRVAEARESGESIRAIAEREGVSHETVRRDLQSAASTVTPPVTVENTPKTSGNTGVEKNGHAEAVKPKGGKVKGKDGRTRTATPKKKPSTKKVAEKAKEALEGKNDGKEEEKLPATDAVDIVLPKHSLEAFATLELFDEIDKAFQNLAKLINDIATKPGAEMCRADLRLKVVGEKQTFYSPDLLNARVAIKSARPHAAICPYCHHEGRKKPNRECNGCKGLPYVIKRVWENAPPDYQQEVLDGAKGGAE